MGPQCWRIVVVTIENCFTTNVVKFINSYELGLHVSKGKCSPINFLISKQ